MAEMTSTTEAAAAIRTAIARLESQTELLELRLAEWHELESRVQANLANVPNVVKLNVGGTTFQTAKDTLLRVKGSYFEALLGSGQWSPDSNGGAYFLDLDPVIFRRVLLFLRTGEVSTEGLTALERHEFTGMMEYLKLTQAPPPTLLCRWDCDNLLGDGIYISPDLRTVEGAHECGLSGVVANKAVVGRVRLRLDNAVGTFCIGIGHMITYGRTELFPMPHQCYQCCSDGNLYRGQAFEAALAPRLHSGDVVTIHRDRTQVEFALNEGAPVRIQFDDPSDALRLFVFMRSAAKITILD